MADGPLVSIIIPAYNAQDFIEASLRSALGQTWTNLEIIVIDDGSLDHTAEVASAVDKERVVLIRQANRGAAAARNAGLATATGKYVQFLDADDILSVQKIELQVRALEHAGPASIASCSWAHFETDPAHSVIAPEPVWTEERPVEWLILSSTGGGMMQPAAWLTPRTTIDKAGPWNEELTLHDDGEFFARVLLGSQRNVFVKDALVYYRTVGGSLSRARGNMASESAFAVCSAKARMLLGIRDDKTTRRAAATEFARFIYEFQSSAPALAEEAYKALRGLGVEPGPSVGGGVFRGLAAIIGFERAMKMRSSLSRP